MSECNSETKDCATCGPTKNTPNKERAAVVSRPRKVNNNAIPEHILNNTTLNEAIKVLPANYNFEIHKTLWKILTEKAECVALQFPEGLLMYACIICDIITRFTGANVIILGDVTYGACCIDDFTAHKLGASLLIHYGHSCLVPVNVTLIKVMYVFVEIQFEYTHLVDVIKANFPVGTKLALLGTIQFTNVVHGAATVLKQSYPDLIIPQVKPLSPGETLGCTSPIFSDRDSFIFVADGRFHLEAAMIQNPHVAAFRYDPYSKIMTREGYDTPKMKQLRWNAIVTARSCQTFGVILGTLGRQGNTVIFERIQKLLEEKGKTAILFLMAEILPQKLAMIPDIDCWVQVACPRLSIDWGSGFNKPILTSYEFDVCMGVSEWNNGDNILDSSSSGVVPSVSSGSYPMDYYSAGGGPWANYSKAK